MIPRRALLLSLAAAPVAAFAQTDAPIRRGYVDAWSGQVHYRAAGALGQGKRPLICFHPSLASGVNFLALMANMGRDRFIVAPDTPGYGLSDPPPAQPTVADYAHAMADVVDRLGFKDFDVLGAHTGSKTAIELARLRPAQVKHVVLIAAPIYTPEAIAELRRRNRLDPPDETGEFLTRAWKSRAAARDPRASLDHVMQKFIEYWMGGDKRVWGQNAAFDYHFEDTIGYVTAPVLVLNAGGDLYDLTLKVEPFLKTGKLINRPDWRPSFLEHDTVEAAQILRGFLD